MLKPNCEMRLPLRTLLGSLYPTVLGLTCEERSQVNRIDLSRNLVPFGERVPEASVSVFDATRLPGRLRESYQKASAGIVINVAAPARASRKQVSVSGSSHAK